MNNTSADNTFSSTTAPASVSSTPLSSSDASPTSALGSPSSSSDATSSTAPSSSSDDNGGSSTSSQSPSTTSSSGQGGDGSGSSSDSGSSSSSSPSSSDLVSSSGSIVSSVYSDGPSFVTEISTSYVSHTGSPNWNTSSPVSSATSQPHSSKTSLSASGHLASDSKKTGGSNHKSVVIGCAVAIPIGVVLILIGLGIFFWKRLQRAKRIKAERMQEVEEYGFNPNQSNNFRGPNRASSPDRYRGWSGSPAPAVASTGSGRPIATRPAAAAPNASPPNASPPNASPPNTGASQNSTSTARPSPGTAAAPGAAAGAGAGLAGGAAAANRNAPNNSVASNRMVRPIGNPTQPSPPDNTAGPQAANNGSNFSEGLGASPFDEHNQDEAEQNGSEAFFEGPLATIPESDTESQTSEAPPNSSESSRLLSRNSRRPSPSESVTSQPNYSPFADSSQVPRRTSGEALRQNMI
ncbi:plasma membrane-associated serine-rich cell wall sensor Mtl2 [Schizosaccharomyces osmophilus]|uniref:Plasma membrane-associated serine-rich cell wall sensor Mtl2 n=1 Tax=Schizosaccharomyces osmophilus TaxID=2545709 RepID=A0AAF0AZB4_9SCHI|nr:plasma membrane-associated serine-rich cell wall sensor Mtl2 [Schizosaccharomyces osmophilus]WBW75048.1 plasma membrane-associated serine-rich cell wall sensor Mtl2 [Schizosaccharomyces osmophilus]